ncbi:integrase core domain-containing protein [Roseibium algicola]|uniref:integrase core domain-containing protein n=1 Tax=Roseibium algicola TaxID=2857014 RepID=UPI003F53930D
MIFLTKASGDECLNDTLFTSLPESRFQITSWKDDHNRNRHHSPPDNLASCECALKMTLQTRAAYGQKYHPKDPTLIWKRTGSRVTPVHVPAGLHVLQKSGALPGSMTSIPKIFEQRSNE